MHASPFLRPEDDDGIGGTGGEPVPHTGTKKSEIKFFWVANSVAGPAAQSRTLSVTVGNVDGKSFKVSTGFKVYEPVAQVSATLDRPYVKKTPDGTLVAAQLGDDKPGLAVSASMTLPQAFTAQGDWNFVQIAKPDGSYVDGDGKVHKITNSGKQGLDSNYPYHPSIPYTSGPAYSTGNTAGAMVDFPSEQILGSMISNGTSMSVADSFTTYIMFKPPGDDSVWVPAESFDWSWSAAAQNYGNSSWFILPGFTPATAGSHPKIVDGSDEPVWTVVLQGPGNWT